MTPSPRTMPPRSRWPVGRSAQQRKAPRFWTVSATSARARLGAPPLDRLGREPHREAAAGAQAGVVLSPVDYLLALSWSAVPAIGVGLARNGALPSLLNGLPPTTAYSQPTPRRSVG